MKTSQVSACPVGGAAGWIERLMRRNLFFILVDCLRADHCYGERGSAITPVFNRLRQLGTSFNQAIAVATNTTPCVGSIMTGLYPFAHGLRQKEAGYKLSPASSTLAEILRQHGYQTRAMVAGDSLHPNTGLDRGFDTYHHRRGKDHLYTEWRKQLDAELDTLARQREPWFLFLHFWEMHAPRYLSAAFNRPEFGKTRYERALSSLDHQLGRLLERVDLERDVIVLLGDHGERFEESLLEEVIRKGKWHLFRWQGGRGWYKLCHGYQVYDYLVRVPLTFLGQGLFPAGGEVTAQVRQIDIMPTILEALGISPNREERIHGRSLMPLIKGESVTELPALMEASGKAIPDSRNWLRGVRVPPWKYIFAPRNPRRPPELYHLGNDPWESKNVVDQHPIIAESLRRTIAEISSFDGISLLQE
ncbi:MAG TPA: sulfatase [Candidatus Methylomirabilis sp.]|nr:sulfatase [Candidatus Methylomirabilis sp.]